ncbi:MAG: low-specificity L-threonine aldolase [Dehalococcoidia bacterium]|nr:low-specificity L-threonine aldolase [Dehalococcoidia bacterium]
MPERAIDLRSDTVTQPTPAMREAMAKAEVGDDVFGEDPTVRRLEAMAAELMGKEAAVFVASGTMGNLTCLLAHCQRGDEAIVGDQAHVLHYEAAGAAAAGSIQLRTVPNDERGMLDLDAVEGTIRGQNLHFPRTAAVCLENTHNRCGGGVLTADEIAEVARVAHRHGVAVHLDGARIFNAAVALGVPASELTAEVDSVTFCLSKGLSAPVGSLVCGSADFVARARRARKVLGGGMRQAGVIAAPGIVALETMIDRLAEDHDNARLLAEGLAQVPGVRIDPERVQTNIVVFEVADGVSFQSRLREQGVLTTAFGPTRVRMVTHYGITRADIDAALARVRQVAEAAA